MAACVPQQQAATRLANDLKDNVYHTSAKVKEWANTPPPADRPPLPVKSSYCYHVLQDILCYRQAMPGYESRLVGYQGTDALPPMPVVTQLMPVPKQEVSIQPANRAANAQPVFVSLPPTVKDIRKEDPNATIGNLTPDPEHEQLPDPASAPQL